MDAQSRPKWERLGRLLAQRRARIDPRYATRKAFSEASGLNLGLLRDLENALRDSYTRPTLAAVETAYQWAPDSIERVLAGGDPIEVTHVTGTAAMALAGTARAQAVALNPVAETEAANEIVPRKLPKWLAVELDRRGQDADLVVDGLSLLRVVAEHYNYTLAELLLESGLADEQDLEISQRPTSPRVREALAEYDEGIRRAASSPFLTPRERKRLQASAAQERQAAIDEHLRDR